MAKQLGNMVGVKTTGTADQGWATILWGGRHLGGLKDGTEIPLTELKAKLGFGVTCAYNPKEVRAQ